MKKTYVIGIDPGKTTGVAVYEDGCIERLYSWPPNKFLQWLETTSPDLVVLEDSRLQSKVWIPATGAALLKVARNIGQVDQICFEITRVCEKQNIPLQSVSPKSKGAKVDAATFKKLTGWAGRTNQHQRDAAMVAWPYRNMRLK